MFRLEFIEFDGWFFWHEGVSYNSRQDVVYEIVKRTMCGVFDHTDVFELIIYRFNNRSFTQHDFIPQLHELVFHIASYSSYKMDTVMEKEIG